MKLIAIGDNVCDCYLDEGIFFPGGNCVNVAVHAKRRGAETVNYTGVFGDDFMADYIKACLAKEGVTVHRSRKVYAPTSCPGVKLVDGDRVFVGGKPDSCQVIFAMKMTKADLQMAAEYDVCHVSCYSNMETELAKLAQVVDVSFDFSDTKDDGYFSQVCPWLTFAFISASEEDDAQCKALAQKLHSLGSKYVCITRGSKGSMLYDGNRFYTQGIVAVDAVDTMGAGDSYIAGFLTCWYTGRDIAQAMAAGAAHAADNCTKRGAIGYAHSLE